MKTFLLTIMLFMPAGQRMDIKMPVTFEDTFGKTAHDHCNGYAYVLRSAFERQKDDFRFMDYEFMLVTCSDLEVIQ